jgi:hypothetical protein
LTKAINSGIVAYSNSLQVRLILYYLSLGDGWDREKEKRDWKNCDLKSLKYETYRLVVRTLTQVSEWDKREVYNKICEVEFAIKNNGFAYALDIIDIVYPKAVEIEEFALAIQIADLQAQIYDNFPDRDDILDLILVNNRRKSELLRSLVDLQSCIEFRRLVVEPIKRDWERNEKVSEVRISVLEKELDRIQKDSLSSKKSKIEFLSAKSLFCLLRADLMEGHKLIGEMMEIYQSCDFLKSNQRRYIQHVRAYVLLSSQLGLEKLARDAMLILEKARNEQPEIRVLSLHSWIKAALRIGHHFDDELLILDAISMLDRHRAELEHEVKDSEMVRLNWWAMTSLGERGSWERANRFGMLLLANKTALKENWLVCARIFVFAITIALFGHDGDRVNDTYRACYEFLRRNKNEYPEAIGVLRKFFDLWRNTISGSESIEIPQSPMYPTNSGNVGSYDFRLIFGKVLERLKGHQ